MADHPHDMGAPGGAALDRRTVLRAGAAGLGALPLSGRIMAAEGVGAAPRPPRERLRLSDGWRFHLGHAADMARDFDFGLAQRTFAKQGEEDAPEPAKFAFDDARWAPVRVPHDWAVELPYARPLGPPITDRVLKDRAASHGFRALGRDHPENSVGWYRRPLEIGAADRDRRVWLEFDGVFRDCLIWVNSYFVGRHESGYAPFRIDITDVIDTDGGPNLLTLRVDATLGEGWFYEGAGIYRHVHLVKAAQVHVPQWGTFVRAEPQADGGARVRVSTELCNAAAVPERAVLRQWIAGPDGTPAARLDEAALDLAARATLTHEAEARIPDARLWSVESPRLYRLVSEVLVAGALVDRYETRFGIRSIRFDKDQGFFLNGRPVKLLGSCNHQDHAGVGTAIPDRLNAWRVEQMQSMGSNAWRSAHNPPSEALLDICDARGMMMIDELRHNSTEPSSLAELDAIVRRDRNHPCIILWSTGNEEPQQGTKRGEKMAAALVRRIKALDPTRLVTQAFYFEEKGYGPGAWNVVDVAALNYKTDRLDAFHAQFPHLPLIGGETGSTVATRGEYENDAARHIVRAYDTEYPFWASTAEQWWPIVAERPFIAGGFIWTGFDYRGEPTPYAEWPSVSSQFGVLDLCGFPKDNYFYYRAWWRPDEPLVHLLPHWNWEGREGRPIEVWAHSNCEEVELIVNGRSAGRKAMPRNRHLQWSVPYAPGRIEAVGYAGGRKVARARRETAGPAHGLRLSADRPRIAADGEDIAMVKVEVVDGAGRIVPRGDAEISFEVSGGALIGVGNGDPNSHEPDQLPQRRAFNGLAQAIVRSRRAAGPIRVTARAEGLVPATLSILALPRG